MAKKKLHPSVEKFKAFVKSNPKIVMEVRNGKATWQELFEEWYILGEDDPRWDRIGDSNNSATKEEGTKNDWFPQIMNTVKNMDANQFQGYIANLSSAIGAIQGVLSQFQSENSSGGGNVPEKSPPPHPFQFRKD